MVNKLFFPKVVFLCQALYLVYYGVVLGYLRLSWGVCVQESAAVQMLLETLLEREEDKTLPGRQWALQEVRSLVCSYLHQVFIADTMLCKLVHFQVRFSQKCCLKS